MCIRYTLQPFRHIYVSYRKNKVTAVNVHGANVYVECVSPPIPMCRSFCVLFFVCSLPLIS